jgi:acetyl esterase/lipase
MKLHLVAHIGHIMEDILQKLRCQAFKKAPPLDPAWLAWEEDRRHQDPPPQFASVLERQPWYAAECRKLLEQMTAPRARDHALLDGIEKTEFTVSSTLDGFQIPVLQFDLTDDNGVREEPEVVIVHYHGGGLYVGEADSEELSCRRLLKALSGKHARLYSVGYRLMPQNPASTCLSDSMDAFNFVHSKAAKTVLVGSSSGGQLAAAIAQEASPGTVHGVMLRCPVTSDPQDGMKYIPEHLRPFHTSLDPSFVTSLISYLTRQIPRDGLETLPIEASRESLMNHAPTWIQLCTNDTLYSDGLCYGMALLDAGVDVRTHVMEGWPHTFWLKAPEMDEALRADEAMIESLLWLVTQNGEHSGKS